MSNSTRRLWIAAPLVLLAACVDNKGSVQLRQICAPPEAADQCSFSDKCEAVSLARFHFDVGAGASNMWMFIETGNQLEDNADPDTGRVNTRDAYVQEVIVSFSGGGLDLADASHRLQQMISAGTTQVLSVYPLPDQAVADLVALAGGGANPFAGGALVDVIAAVKLKGVYADGDEFETAALEIPVRLCDGCLGTMTCAAGDVLFACPPSAAVGNTLPAPISQIPASFTCVTP